MAGEHPTRAEVKDMISEALKSYDKEVSAPRHEQNLGKFDSIFGLINKGKGAFIAFGVTITLMTGLAAAIEIWRFVHGK